MEERYIINNIKGTVDVLSSAIVIQISTGKIYFWYDIKKVNRKIYHGENDENTTNHNNNSIAYK